MLTPRAWWFLFWIGFLTLVGVTVFAFDQPRIPILAFTLLLWFVVEWAIFSARVRLASSRLWVEREVIVGGRVVPTIWAGTSCTVRLRVGVLCKTRFPYVVVSDTLPPGLPAKTGRRRESGSLDQSTPLTIEYTLAPEWPGVAHFDGVEVRIADLCGFFYHRIFLRAPLDCLILPPITDDEGNQRATKRFNTLPPPGEHRLRRPGGGSELLDLRDYRPGDPPKTIAWKASARRDRLVTKEFESDVPVRCILFLDASTGTRLGEPGATPLARSTALAAAVAQAASASRDIVGLCVFDEDRSRLTKPARTRVHHLRLLHTLGETAALRPDNTDADPALVEHMAYSLAQQRYPELIGRRWNTRPFGLYWRPLLDSKLSRILILPAVVQGAMYYFWLPVLNAFVGFVRELFPPRNIFMLVPMLLVVSFLFFLPTFLTVWAWWLYGLRGFFAPFGDRLSRRKRLAALFTSVDQDSPAAIERYIADNPFLARRCIRFLNDHHVAIPPVLYDESGRYRYRNESKVRVLANALVRSVGTARDNELYVILADLLELVEDIEPFLRAVRTARSRHHLVMVLIAWPADLPAQIPASAGRSDDLVGQEASKGRRKPAKFSLGDVVGAGLSLAYQRKFDALRLAIVRAGGSVVRIDAAESVGVVLERLEGLRHARIRR